MTFWPAEDTEKKKSVESLTYRFYRPENSLERVKLVLVPFSSVNGGKFHVTHQKREQLLPFLKIY